MIDMQKALGEITQALDEANKAGTMDVPYEWYSALAHVCNIMEKAEGLHEAYTLAERNMEATHRAVHEPCATCRGSGISSTIRRTNAGKDVDLEPCPECGVDKSDEGA